MAATYVYCDAHLHLQDARFTASIDAVIARGEAVGVRRMLCNATREEDWHQVLALARAHEGVVPFLGIHPWNAATVRPGWVKRLASQLERSGCGIGEVGLDRRCGVDLRLQEEVFTQQFDLAVGLRRPLVVHCLHCWGRLIELLTAASSSRSLPPLMIHSFSGSMETMRQLVRFGCYLSFSSRMLAPEGEKIRQVFREVPLASLLLETDSPDQFCQVALDVQYDKDKAVVNEPAFIPPLYRYAADLKNMKLDEFCNRVWTNGSIFTHSAIFR